METHLTLKGAIAALNAVKEATRGNVVTPEELLRRSAICQRCPMKGRTRGVSQVGQILTRLFVKHGVPEAMRNQVCKACGCPLELLLATLPENLHKDSPLEEKRRPSYCWARKPQK